MWGPTGIYFRTYVIFTLCEYVYSMPQSIQCDLFLYADDSCFVFQHKSVKEIEVQLNKNFSSICDWLVDNKISIHFRTDKVKSIFFSSKRKRKQLDKLNIIYQGIHMKQHSKVIYLGCILDKSLSGESMAVSVINKINSRLKILQRKIFNSPAAEVRNALMQPQSDYACSA